MYQAVAETMTLAEIPTMVRTLLNGDVSKRTGLAIQSKGTIPQSEWHVGAAVHFGPT